MGVKAKVEKAHGIIGSLEKKREKKKGGALKEEDEVIIRRVVKDKLGRKRVIVDEDETKNFFHRTQVRNPDKLYSLREVAKLAKVDLKGLTTYNKQGLLDEYKRYPEQTGFKWVKFTGGAIKRAREIRDAGIRRRGFTKSKNAAKKRVAALLQEVKELEYAQLSEKEKRRLKLKEFEKNNS